MSAKPKTVQRGSDEKSTSSSKSETSQDWTPCTLIVIVFSVLVIVFLAVTVLLLTYEGLFVSNKSVNPELSLEEAGLKYAVKGEEGKEYNITEKVNLWWFVINLYIYFYSCFIFFFSSFF